jgi:hypothetical protein
VSKSNLPLKGWIDWAYSKARWRVAQSKAAEAAGGTGAAAWAYVAIVSKNSRSIVKIKHRAVPLLSKNRILSWMQDVNHFSR